MKKNLKKTFAKATALAMAVAMMVSVVPANSADAKAKKPKLAKSVKVTVKKTKKVKIKNTKTIKKTKWSIKSKKVATLSKKKKTSVVVKGKKAGSTKLTAKVTLKNKKKKTLKMTVKVVKAKPTTKPKTTPTPKPTTKPTTKPNQSTAPNQTTKPGSNIPPSLDKIGDVNVDKSATVEIPVTELNETSVTCDAKHTEDYLEKTGTENAAYGKNGLTFTTTTTYNGGHMFYLDPITSEADLEEAPDGKNNSGRWTKTPVAGKGEKVDIADYDYIVVTLKDSPYETNIRLYDDLDQFAVEATGWIGTCSTFYGRDSEGRGDYVGKEPVDSSDPEGNKANHYYKDAAKTQDAGDGYAILSVKDAVKEAKSSEFIGIAVCGQFKNQDYTISRIELVKVENSVPANKPVSVVVSAEGDKKAIIQEDTLQLSADVLNKNETKLTDTVTWSVTAGDAATVSATGLVTAAADKTGTVTVTATSTLDNTVKGTYEVEVVDKDTPMSVAFTNEYQVYTTAETTDGALVGAQALNGAGEPVAQQPTITITGSKATNGITYEDGKVKGTVAGSIELTATAGDLTATTEIKVVEGQRVALTTDNTAKFGYDAQKATLTVENGVATLTTGNWASGMAVKVALEDGKTAANVKGLLCTLASDDMSGGTDRNFVVEIQKSGIEDDIVSSTELNNKNNTVKLYESPDTNKTAYAGQGLDCEATWKWADIDADVDLTATEPWFRFGVNSDKMNLKVSNVIVLTGDADAGVKYENNTAEVVVGDTCELTAKMVTLPKDDTVKSITFESSDTTVATVAAGTLTDNTNKVTVTGVKAGTADVTATMETTKGSKVTAKATVTVVDPSVKINAIPSALIMGSAAYCTTSKEMTATVKASATDLASATYKWEITAGDTFASLSDDTTDTATLTPTAAGAVTVKLTVTISGTEYTDTVSTTIQADKFENKTAAFILPVEPKGAAYNAPNWGTVGSNDRALLDSLGTGATVKLTYKYYDVAQNEITKNTAGLFQIAQMNSSGGGPNLLGAELELDGSGTFTWKNEGANAVKVRQIVVQNKKADTGVSYFVVENVEVIPAEDTNA